MCDALVNDNKALHGLLVVDCISLICLSGNPLTSSGVIAEAIVSMDIFHENIVRYDKISDKLLLPYIIDVNIYLGKSYPFPLFPSSGQENNAK